MGKKNFGMIVGLFIIVIGIGLFFFLSKKDKKNISNSTNKIVEIKGKKIIDGIIVESTGENIPNDKLRGILTGNINKIILENENKDENKQEITEEKKVFEIVEKKGYKREINNYIKSICQDKTNIDDITCSANYRFFVPRLYGLLISMNKNDHIAYDNVESLMVSSVTQNCKLDDYGIELLIRGIKENDTSCTKEVTQIYKQNYKKLQDLFKTYNLSEKTLKEPFVVYYHISNDLNDKYQRQLQILILENVSKQAKQKYGSVENFKQKMLSYVGADSIENLKNLILQDYENIFKKYNLKQCGLKLEGYDNYFVWIPIEKKAVKCFKEKNIVDKDFLKDYNKFEEKLSIYTYLTKNFIGEKAVAKALFGQEGIGITNILDVYAIYNEN